MRLCTMSLVAICLSAGGCNQAPAGAVPTTGDSVAAPRADAPVATVGAGAVQANPVEASRADVGEAREEIWREVTIPAGTSLPVILDTSVGSDVSRVEMPVGAHLSRAVSIDGVAALPQGSLVTGVVTDATRSAKVKGRAHVGIRFDTITPAGSDEEYSIETGAIGRAAPAPKRNDAVKIGAPAAGGAIVGAILGGKKGALIGTAAGGGAGTAVVLSTRGKEIRLAKGTPLTVRLTQPLTVRIRG